MFSLFHNSKEGLPDGLLLAHDFFLEDIIAYFEKGRNIRKGVKEAEKAIKKARKLTKKKNIHALEDIESATKVLNDFREDLKYTQKALETTFVSLENALMQIEEERVNEPLSIIDEARELIRNRKYEKAVGALRRSGEKIREKVLRKTRTSLFGGLSNEVKSFKDEIEALKKKRLSQGHAT